MKFPTLRLFATRILCRIFNHSFVDHPDDQSLLRCETCHTIRYRRSLSTDSGIAAFEKLPNDETH